MKKVYVAGAISAANLEKGINNIRKGILAGAELLKKGFAPYIPHLDYQINLVQDETIPVETYYKYDLEWLKCCDCMLVLPGYEKSIGVKAEIEFAKSLNIPIYFSMEELEKDIHNQSMKKTNLYVIRGEK